MVRAIYLLENKINKNSDRMVRQISFQAQVNLIIFNFTNQIGPNALKKNKKNLKSAFILCKLFDASSW